MARLVSGSDRAGEGRPIGHGDGARSEPDTNRAVAADVARQGYAIVPGFLPLDDIAPALDELPLMFPSADEFADDVDPRRNDRFRAGQFGGVDVLPFESLAWNLLAVHPRLLDVAEAVLATDDIRMYRAEAWAKYQQAVDYDQTLHRDFLNHSLVVPTDDPRFGQVEMFVYLTEMTPDLGPTHVVPTEHTAHIPPIPNHLDRVGHAELYERGELVLGPPGTLLVYRTDLVHRGTAIRRPRAARFTLHLNVRTAAAEWANRGPWGDTANRPAWTRFVGRCGPRELALFGFPRPGHEYWTEATLRGVASRYPDLDMSPWWAASR